MLRYTRQLDPNLIARRVLALVDPHGTWDKASAVRQHISDSVLLPAGNVLLAAARGDSHVSPNCTILPPIHDHALSDTLDRARPLWDARTGIGFNLSFTSDPVATLRTLAAACEESRRTSHDNYARGNMAVLSLWHPRLEEFVNCKQTASLCDELRTFNVSVAVSDFDSDKLTDSSEWKFEETASWLNNQRLLSIVQAARKTGCPGVMFPMWVNKAVGSHTANLYGQVTTLVPCGEQGMHDNESCTLGALNLAADALRSGTAPYINPLINDEKLAAAAAAGVALLDKLVDVTRIGGDSCYNAKTLQTTLALRRIGLGVTGWADALEIAGLPYDSEEAVAEADRVARVYTAAARDASKALHKGSGRFNVSTTCIQPTGNLSSVFGVRGYSIEPFFEQATSIGTDAHLNMLRAWQRHVDTGVSKTVNMPADSSMEDVASAFASAYANAVKSVTVYVDHSRVGQPIVL